MYSRTRTKGAPVLQLFGATQTMSGAGVSPSVYVYPNLQLGIGASKVTSDQVIPDFKSRSAAGELFFNSFERQSSSFVVDRVGFFSAKRDTPTYAGEGTPWQALVRTTCLGSSYPYPARVGQPIDSVFQPHVTAILLRNAASDDVAVNAALSDIAKTDLMLLVSLGELRETLALIRKYSRLLTTRLAPLRDFVYNLRKGRYSAKEIAVMASSQWLEYRYGIMPLVYEIEGVVKALGSKVAVGRLTARGKTSWEDSETSTINIVGTSGYYPSMSFVTTTRITAKYSAGFLYEPLLQGTAATLGLHLSHVPEAMFELTRLSFVANWFMDLSESIRALTASVRGDVKGGWLTRRYEISSISSVNYTGMPATTVMVGGVAKPVQWSIVSQEGAMVTATRSVVQRVPLTSVIPRLPSVRLHMTPARVADAIALTASSFLDISNHRRTMRL